jgi:hypothetical protein
MERPKIVRLLVKEILFGEDTITHFVTAFGFLPFHRKTGFRSLKQSKLPFL